MIRTALYIDTPVIAFPFVNDKNTQSDSDNDLWRRQPVINTALRGFKSNQNNNDYDK